MEAQTGEIRTCQNCRHNFAIEPEDFNFYEKIKVPPPTFCPECRLIRRMIWRNERSLYKRACDLCGKKIISMYEEGVPFPVYCPECWKGDARDPFQYGTEYDFNKPFFKQWHELFLRVPRQSTWQTNDCINTEYANFVQEAKNIYLAYSVIYGSEDVYYSNNIDGSKKIVDALNAKESELVYEGIGSVKNYNCRYAYWSSNCLDCDFVFDCVNCSNCFSCVNLRNKKYHIWNREYSREEYFERLKELNTGSYKSVQENLEKFWKFYLQFPRKYAKSTNSVNSTGDEIRECKNAHFVFSSYESEDVKFIYRSLKIKDAMDACHLGKNSEMVYEHGFGGSDHSTNVKFVLAGAPAVSDVEYIDYCQSSSHLFGCIGLRSKKYCILNKQYKKEEYLSLTEKIKDHMMKMPYIDTSGITYRYGELFPYEFSPFGYNETMASALVPLSKEEVLKRGYRWKEKAENKYEITKKADDLPDDIKDADDTILNEVVECAATKRPFRITKFEIDFYRRMNIPLPRLHQDERYRRRMALCNPLKLWHRKCMKEGCTNEFETSYAPERPEIVYCERCYQGEVY